MGTMKASEWNALIYGHSTLHFLSKPLERLGMINKARALRETFLTIRNSLRLEKVLPLTQHDRVCRAMRSILNKSATLVAELEGIPSQGVILFPLLRGGSYLELLGIFLAHRLRFEGYRPLFLVCGGLPICNFFNLGQDARRNPEICQSCTRNHRQLLQAGGLPFRMFTTTPERAAQALEQTRGLSAEECYCLDYRDTPVGKLLVPSVARHFRRNALPANEVEEIKSWRAYAAAGCILVDHFLDLFAQVRPVRGIMPGGWFFWDAIAHNLLSRNQIESIFYEAAFHDPPKGNRWMFSQTVPLSDPKWITPAWEEWRDVPLTAAENQHLDWVLAQRRQGSIYHPEPLEAESDIRHQLKLPKDGRPVLTLFPGLTWDYAVYGEGPAAFRDMVEWVLDTIRTLAGQQVWAIVRLHPAEAILHEGVYSRENLVELIEQNIGKPLPSNLRIVPAQSKISSYSLFDLADAVAVYASTIGLETVIVGKKPLILASYSILNDRGFGYAPETREAYFNLISRIATLQTPKPAEIEAARRFIYLYFFRSSWPLHFFESGERGLYSIDRVLLLSLDELRPGKNQLLDQAVKAIQGKASFAIPREFFAPPVGQGE